MATRMNALSRVLVSACAVAAIPGLVLVGSLHAGYPQQVPTAESGSPDAGQDQDTASQGEAPAEQPDEGIELRGRVLGPDGRPIEGARLYLMRSLPNVALDYPAGAWPAPRVRAMTGADGYFEFRALASEMSAGQLLATGPEGRAEAGYGIAWQRALDFEPSGKLQEDLMAARPEYASYYAERGEPILRLVNDDVPLVGHIVDSKGKPVGGATVSAFQVWRLENEDMTAILNAMQHENVDYDHARIDYVESFTGSSDEHDDPGHILTATTDREGKFRLRGIGRERIAYLLIEGPGIQSHRVHARTRPGPTLRVTHIHNAGPGSAKFTFYGADFKHAAPPSRLVLGTVRDLDSGRPVAGVVIQKLAGEMGDPMDGGVSCAVCAVTDDQGRYRLTGLPIRKDIKLRAVSLDHPYLPSRKDIETPAEKDSVRIDFGLKRGAWISGRVTDAQSGKPLRTRVEYFAFFSNPHGKSAPGFEGLIYRPSLYSTDKDGRYAIPALPGRGIVAVNYVHWGGTYPKGAGAEETKRAVGEGDGRGLAISFMTRPMCCSAFLYHALADVDVAEGAEMVVRDFELDRGETLHGKVLDPEGRPLAGANCSGTWEATSGYLLLPSEDFRVKHFRPDGPRTLVFFHNERKLAGSLILQGPQKEPVTVRLEPWGVLTGRVVDAEGKPKPEATLANMPYSLTADPATARRLPEWYYFADKSGRFRIEGLAPGMKYKVGVVLEDSSMPIPLVIDATVKSGETKNLGDVTAKPPRSPDRP